MRTALERIERDVAKCGPWLIDSWAEGFNAAHISPRALKRMSSKWTGAKYISWDMRPYRWSDSLWSLGYYDRSRVSFKSGGWVAIKVPHQSPILVSPDGIDNNSHHPCWVGIIGPKLLARCQVGKKESTRGDMRCRYNLLSYWII